MLGRKNFTQDEIDRAKSAVARQLRTYEAVFAAEARPWALSARRSRRCISTT